MKFSFDKDNWFYIILVALCLIILVMGISNSCRNNKEMQAKQNHKNKALHKRDSIAKSNVDYIQKELEKIETISREIKESLDSTNDAIRDLTNVEIKHNSNVDAKLKQISKKIRK